MPDVVMPKLSDTMEEGKILRWLKKPGEHIAKGDVLAEVETDKADMELEAEAEGVLEDILVDEGGSAAVGDKIATLSEGSGNGHAKDDGEAKAPAERKREARSESEPEESEEEVDDEEQQVEEEVEDAPRPKKRPTVPPRARTTPPPLRSRSEETEQEKQPQARSEKKPAPKKAKAPAAGEREELSKIRRTVARRMAESKREVPHFYTTVELDMTEMARLKASLATARPDESVSYTHLLVKAVALALAEHPRINARYVPEDTVEFSSGIHIGIAVALAEGLIVPVLHDCESKDIFEIAADGRDLVERVRSGKAGGGDLSGGTFTISNLGMFPIDEFAAVINPPQAAVLAVGSLAERAVVRDGQVVARSTMRVTLSSDHRVIDGAEAAQFLATLKSLIENPLRLVL